MGNKTLLVKQHHGIQVKHWHAYLFWCDVIIGFDTNDDPILGEMIAVSQYDNNGDSFYPSDTFEVQYNPGKFNMVPYEWQPVAPKQKIPPLPSKLQSIFGRLIKRITNGKP